MHYKRKLFLRGLFFTVLIAVIAPSSVHAEKKEPPLQVIVYEAAQVDWSDSVRALGTLRANEAVQLTASVTDTITKIHFEDGQRVNKGAVLIEMTDSEEQALVQEMTARVAEAKRQFDRVKSLPKTGAVSESLFDQREREFRAATAQLEAMASRLKDRLILAPFSGVVGLRTISVGALVEPGDEIVTLIDDSKMKLDFTVPSLYLSQLLTGLKVVAETRAFPEKSFEGTVTAVDSKVDPVTRAISVRAIVPNEERLLKQGLLMTVRLRFKERTTLSVPEEALIPVGEENDVFVVNKDSLEVDRRRVTIGSRQTGAVEIISGVNQGEFVITHGTVLARAGKKVTIRAIQGRGQSIEEILAEKPESP